MLFLYGENVPSNQSFLCDFMIRRSITLDVKFCWKERSSEHCRCFRRKRDREDLKSRSVFKALGAKAGFVSFSWYSKCLYSHRCAVHHPSNDHLCKIQRQFMMEAVEELVEFAVRTGRDLQLRGECPLWKKKLTVVFGRIALSPHCNLAVCGNSLARLIVLPSAQAGIELMTSVRNPSSTEIHISKSIVNSIFDPWVAKSSE
jgi:hypothetical protein